jgi:hypothetical protein
VNSSTDSSPLGANLGEAPAEHGELPLAVHQPHCGHVLRGSDVVGERELNRVVQVELELLYQDGQRSSQSEAATFPEL